MNRCLLGLVLMSSIAAPAFSKPAEPDLATVRTLTERFRDVNVALAEGYIRDPMNVCDTAPMMGRSGRTRRDGRALFPARTCWAFPRRPIRASAGAGRTLISTNRRS